MEKNAKNFKNELSKYGVFYTPRAIAEIMKSYIDMDIEEVYDPTVGSGELLTVFDDGVKKYGQELFPEELEKAKNKLCNFKGYSGDTLKNDMFRGRKFQIVFSNPPYSTAWEPVMDERFEECGVLAPKSKADFAFLLHCLHHLKDDGICITLMFPGTSYRGNSEKRIREWLVENNYIERVVSVPGDHFVDTKISTLIYVIRKNKTTTDVIFEDLSNHESATVKVETIKENNYGLTPSLYIEKHEEKERIDINEVSSVARKSLLSHIQSSLEFEFRLLELNNAHDEYKKLCLSIIGLAQEYLDKD